MFVEVARVIFFAECSIYYINMLHYLVAVENHVFMLIFQSKQKTWL